MLSRAAIERFRRRQEALLEQTYDDAWRAGRAGYVPDSDPPGAEGTDLGRIAAPASAGAAGVLLARRSRPYVPPAEPDAAAKRVALAPARRSLQSMTVELSNVIPGTDHAQAADDAVTAGTINPSERASYALGLAVAGYAAANAYRLDGGDSVAWAGEQDGYAQAATADGMLLEWISEDDDAVCDDCAELAGLPPMPLEDWPTTPGGGDTICSVGCRCSLDASDSIELEPLTEQQNFAVDRIAAARSETLISAPY